MIDTYNHEINTPLAVALGIIKQPNLEDPSNILVLKNSLCRITDIVKKIKALSDKKEIYKILIILPSRSVQI